MPFLFHNVVDVPCQGGGFLGSAFDPLQIAVDVEKRAYRAGSLAPPDGRTFASVGDRRRLLSVLESQLNANNSAERQWRAFYDRAYSLLGSETLRRAARSVGRIAGDSRPLRVQAGRGGEWRHEPIGDGRRSADARTELARRAAVGRGGRAVRQRLRLPSAGTELGRARQQLFHHKNYLLPQTDQSLSALIEDLDQRGLLDSTLVVAMGEFGRTPRINANAGRDHWPDCYSVLLAGGGVKGGTVYGSSDRLGMYPETNPVSPADLTATIFSRFGIDPMTEIHDTTARPHRISDGRPIRELFVA